MEDAGGSAPSPRLSDEIALSRHALVIRRGATLGAAEQRKAAGHLFNYASPGARFFGGRLAGGRMDGQDRGQGPPGRGPVDGRLRSWQTIHGSARGRRIATNQ